MNRLTAVVAAGAIALGSLLATAPAANADVPATTAPLLERTPDVATADALPTVQIDSGYVWAQTMIGNRVYAVGSFSNARAAGAAPGTSLTPRTNALSYDITNGNLLSWAPQVNGVIKSVAASPDGTRIYIGGSFTQVNGATRFNFAALDATTGALVSGFTPSVGGTGVYAITTSGNAVYVAGLFSQANSVARKNLAAFSADNGALLGWAPTTDLQVDAMVMEPGNQKVIIGGRFYTVNDVGGEQRGIAALDPATGATVPWAVTNVIKNGWNQGSTAGKTGIFGLNTDATGVYGTGWTYADVNAGNIEGTFAVDPGAGNLRWLADCHGDHYGVFSTGKVVYSTSHTHQCDTVNLWPEQPTRQYRYIEAYTADARGTLSRTPSESNIYKNWAGTPSPSAYAWYPDFTVGTASGLGQAGLSITGTGDYISVAGEFGSVNNQRFQGLVRFSTKPSTGAKQGPRLSSTTWTPTATSTNAGEVRIKVPSNWDRDDMNLTYEVRRDGVSTPVATAAGQSTWWNRPGLLFKDATVVAGQTYTYRVIAKDPNGNSATSAPVTVVASSTPLSAYAKAVIDDGAAHFWPLNDPNGTVGADWAGATDLVVNNATRGQAGQNLAASSSATEFAGNDTSYGVTSSSEIAANTFSVEAWFKTTSTSGGKIAGFGSNPSGTSGSYDRHIYLSNSGRLTFGVYPGSVQTVQSGDGYNDGQWHQVVATLSADGMAMYVDGVLVGSRQGVTSGQDYTGYWRVGGDNTGGWPDAGRSSYVAATIADVSVFTAALTPQQVANHYLTTGRGQAAPPAPADAYGKAVYDSGPAFYWRFAETSGSTAADSGPGPIGTTGTIRGGVTLAQPGPLAGGVGSSISLSPNGQTGVTSDRPVNNPLTYSLETWFKTTSTSGGKLIGMGDRASGDSSSNDRHVYVTGDGTVKFGVWNGREDTVQGSSGYNDGQWHYVVATQSSAGMALYIDGQLKASNGVSTAQGYSGYWRVGGDSGWEGATYFTGSLAESAVYNKALSANDVAGHYAAGTGRTAPAAPADAYGQAVFNSAPSIYWRLDEVAGSTAGDSSPSLLPNTGTYRGGVTQGQSGAIVGGVGKSIALSPNGQTGVAADNRVVNPTTYSLETWFKTTTTQGGKLIGFGDRNVGESGNYDRHVYMSGDGTVKFGVWPGSATIIQSNSGYNDGAWHHVVATQSSAGMTLFLDGQLVASDPQTGAQNYSGYWRIGGDSGWEGATYWTGSLDEAAVYPVALSAADVAAHYAAGSGQEAPNNAPKDLAFTATVDGLSATFAGSATDADGDALTYAWDFGDGQSGSGEQVTHVFNGSGTFAVTLTVTDARAASTVLTKDVTVLHAAPVASFTTDVNALKLVVDGSGSTASDGATLSYSWNWGDNSPLSSGATAEHTFAAAGTYTVTLTATDSLGASTSIAKQIVTTHSNPVASFTKATDKLKVNVDGSGSTASDGAALSYSWNWGDNSPVSSGVTAEHTYAAAGTYSVTLTVTDSMGSSGSTTQDVTVSIPPTVAYVASDSFGRTATNGWGTADNGGAWSILSGSTSVAAVQSGKGVLTLPAGQTRNLALSATVRDSQNTVSYTLPNAPASGSSYVGLGARRIGSSYYVVRAWHRDNGTIWLVAQNGSTVITSRTINGLTWAAGDTFQLKTEVTGANPTTIRAKIWKSGTQEPTSWQLETTDATAALQTAGAPLIQYAVAGTATAAGVARFDDLTVRDLAAAPSNVPPVAAFTSSASGLTASVDGSSSTDSDGTIASYTWKWGDGSPDSTGATATHAYGAPGSYSVQLTVVDNAGAATSLTKTVTVTAAPASNVPPVAAFTSSASGLTASVDGSSSTDSDGTIASYTWKWGDGSPDSTGATATHAYGAPGSYSVQLTVVDNAGAATSLTKTVTVTAPAAGGGVNDAFERAAASGWGSADAGGPWTISGGAASAAAVSNGTGTLTLAPGSTRVATLAQTSLRDVSTTVKFSASAEPSTGGSYVGVIARSTGSNYYLVNAWLRSDGSVWLVAQRGSTVLQTVPVSGLTYAAGDQFILAVDVSGTGTSTISAKIWKNGAETPSAPQIQTTDSSADLQGPGSVGVRASRPASSTSTTVVAFDDFVAAPLG